MKPPQAQKPQEFQNAKKMKKYALLIILTFALAMRLVHLNSPPIGVHQWRQTQTAMIARNFHEKGYKFFHPQIDWAGDDAGYAETDFPVYSFAVAIGYGAFGDHDWVGRLTTVVFSLLTIYFLYLLVRKFLDEKTALWSAFFLSILPLAAFYGRAIMPESLMLMSTVAGLYFFSAWLDNEKKACFILSAIFAANACLLKPTSLYMGLPLLYLAISKSGKRTLKTPALYLYAVLVFGSVFAWYYHAHSILLDTGNTIGLYDKWLNWGLLAEARFWNRIVVKSLLERHFAWFGFPVFIAGVFMARRDRKERLFDLWLLAVVIYILIAGQGNFAHDYYQLPFMLPGVVFMAKVYSRRFEFNKHSERIPRGLPRGGASGLQTINSLLENSPQLAAGNFKGYKKDWQSLTLTIALIGIVVFSVIRYRKFLKNEDVDSSVTYQSSRLIRETTGDKDLIITITDGDPSILYFSHRKGWVAATHEVTDEYLSKKIKKGAKYLTGVYWRFDRPEEQEILKQILSSRDYEVLHDDKKDFFILGLKGNAIEARGD